MGENIVERVADAIGKASENEYAGTLDIARAAIAALREPSEAMIEAGAKCHDHYAGAGTVGAANARRNIRQILVAAIDTILTEGTEHDQG